MLAVGDEILSGRTQDVNINHLARALSLRGIDLCEARIVPDVHERIMAAVRNLSVEFDYVFTSGGIGPTHDDITADAVAAAFQTPIDVREDARAILARHCQTTGIELNSARLRMARIPQGASLIHNSVSGAPGFSIGNVHVMAGVPKIFQAMLASLLPSLQGGSPLCKSSLEVQMPEGALAEQLGGIASEFADLQIGSYPFRKNDRLHVNIVVTGNDRERVDSAKSKICETFAPHLVTTSQTEPTEVLANRLSR